MQPSLAAPARLRARPVGIQAACKHASALLLPLPHRPPRRRFSIGAVRPGPQRCAGVGEGATASSSASSDAAAEADKQALHVPDSPPQPSTPTAAHEGQRSGNSGTGVGTAALATASAWGEAAGSTEDELPGARALTLKDVDWGELLSAGRPSHAPMTQRTQPTRWTRSALLLSKASTCNAQVQLLTLSHSLPPVIAPPPPPIGMAALFGGILMLSFGAYRVLDAWGESADRPRWC